jgi:hypothetical protein
MPPGGHEKDNRKNIVRRKEKIVEKKSQRTRTISIENS